jgi:hypothetical protein
MAVAVGAAARVYGGAKRGRAAEALRDSRSLAHLQSTANAKKQNNRLINSEIRATSFLFTGSSRWEDGGQ